MQLVRWRKAQASDLVTAGFESWILNLFHTNYVILQLYIAAQVLSVLTGKMGIITWSTLQHHWGLKGKVGFPGGSDSKEFPWVGEIPWGRERLPTPVLLPGEFHGQKSLASYSPCGCKQLDTTEQLPLTHSLTHSEEWVCIIYIHVYIHINTRVTICVYTRINIDAYALNGGFPSGSAAKEPTCQCRRCKTSGYDPWVGKIPWRRKWQPTPVFFCEKSQGQRSVVGSQLGRKELDMTECTRTQHSTYMLSVASQWGEMRVTRERTSLKKETQLMLK